MSEVASIITALVGAAVPIGGAGAFVWNKIERRFTEIEAELEKCRSRELSAQKRSGLHITVIELLWQEIKRLHPADSEPATLGRAKKLLDDAKEVE